jgi:hypothetical protein
MTDTEKSPVHVSWNQVLAWRLRRQYVDPLGDVDAGEIVSRLCGVQAQVASAAEFAVAVRQQKPAPETIVPSLADGSLVKTWAMRGTLHLFRSAEAANYLSLLAAARIWAKPTWQRAFGATPEQVEELCEVAGQILDGQVMTRDELVRAVVAQGRLAGMETQLRSGWGSLLKPLAWTGVLCYGPSRGKSVTFTSPASLIPDWKPLPEPDEAAPAVIRAYLGAYGPSTPEVFDKWLSRSSHKKTTVRRWFHDVGEGLTEVDIEGQRGFLCTEHVDELASTAPSDAVRMLGAFDQYVLGPGTGDTVILPREHRSDVSRTAGWISPIVVAGGRVVGVWENDNGEVAVNLFDDVRSPGARQLKAEAKRVMALAGAKSVRIA